jgi:hypothetical protein
LFFKIVDSISFFVEKYGKVVLPAQLQVAR